MLEQPVVIERRTAEQPLPSDGAGAAGGGYQGLKENVEHGYALFTLLRVVTVSWVYNLIKLYTVNMCMLFSINYIPQYCCFSE